MGLEHVYCCCCCFAKPFAESPAITISRCGTFNLFSSVSAMYLLTYFLTPFHIDPTIKKGTTVGSLCTCAREVVGGAGSMSMRTR